MSSTVINLVIFTFLVVERVILIQYGVADKTQLIYTLFTLDVALFIVYLYTSICYKYFVLGFIVFMVLFMGVFYCVFQVAAFVPVSNAVFKLGLPVVALLGYIAIFAGGALEIFDRRAALQEAFCQNSHSGDFSVMQSSDVTVPT